MPRPPKVSEAVAPQKFDPASLSQEDQEAVVELYLGVHPKYYIYEGLGLRVNEWAMNHDRIYFNGFKPHRRELGIG